MTTTGPVPVRRLVQTVRKLRGRSLDELKVRGQQAVAAYFERVGVTDCDIGFNAAVTGGVDATTLLARLRDPSRRRSFAGLTQRESTVAALRASCPEAERDVIDRAERALAGRFDLLGFRDVSFGDPIDWVFDPVAGRRAPSIHWSRIPFLNYDAVGDHKLIWELNRHQYFVTLGQAYWYTGDVRFASAFANHAEQWLEKNPPKLGINWASSLEVAFRAISWTWALQLFRDSKALTPGLLGRMVASLSVHARHLSTYLSTYFSPNTHLTGEALGLYSIARAFPELDGAREWEELGRSILVGQLPRQVRSDGVYFEQASYYHRYTVDFFLHLLLIEGAHSDTAKQIERPLRKLLDHLMLIARPDGTSPLFGDDDGGRLLFLDLRRSDDFRPSLSSAAVVFGSPEYAFAASVLSSETIWLAGPGAVKQWSHLTPTAPRRTSAAFDESGYYVMRDHWSPKANTLLIDCGHHGILNCGHAHADALAIEVVANGRTMLADPGTFTYTASSELRNHFRSSLSHSTVAVDGESSSRPASAFTWETKATVSPLQWYSDSAFDFFAGSHNGYERLDDPVIHRRSILHVKGDYWIVRDMLDAAQRHRAGIVFQATAGVQATALSPRAVRLAPNDAPDAQLDIVCTASGGSLSIDDAWTSQVYGARSAAPRCTFTFEMSGSADVMTCLIPRSADAERWELLQDRTAERSVSLRRGSIVDTLMNGVRQDGLDAGTESIDVDADVLWTRRCEEQGRFTRCVALGVRHLRLGGLSVVGRGQSAEWIVADRHENEWVVRRNEPVRSAR